MDDDQQFCLRWNNHQSTLVAVFDTLLENGTLVDCTLAAEGKCLNAHKVVLSACSPYFESLLSRHFDKHPILILKDVKFQELKAMMDYMYRGEVNISQDQLGALLKAAESLQIKGLSDNRKGETERKPTPAPPPPKSPQQTSALPKVQGLTIEQRSRDDSREGSMSPGPRKKKRLRRKSEELDNHDASNSSESHSLPAQNIPSSLPAVSKINADVPEPVETKSEILRHKQPDDIPQVPIIKEKIETHTELMLEPKSEYVEEMNEDSIEDLTLDDDDLSNMEQMDDQAGPSHGNTGEGSSQGFGGWHMGNQSQDEVFLAAQEAVGAHRDSQGDVFKYDPLLAVSRIEDEAGKTIYNCSVKNPPKRQRRRKTIDKETKVEVKSEKRIPKPKIFHKETVRKLKRKYVTEKHQNVLVCEKNGKMVVTVRCVLCNAFVRKGEQICTRCTEFVRTGKRPPRRLKQKIKSLAVEEAQQLPKADPVSSDEQQPKQPRGPRKWTTKQICEIAKPVKKKKKCTVATKKIVHRRKNLARCASCNSAFVSNAGDVCKTCCRKLIGEDQKLKLEQVKAEREFEVDLTVQTLNNIENIEIVQEDDDFIIDTPSSETDYYVSISDINKLLDEDSEVII